MITLIEEGCFTVCFAKFVLFRINVVFLRNAKDLSNSVFPFSLPLGKVLLNVILLFSAVFDFLGNRSSPQPPLTDLQEPTANSTTPSMMSDIQTEIHSMPTSFRTDYKSANQLHLSKPWKLVSQIWVGMGG